MNVVTKITTERRFLRVFSDLSSGCESENANSRVLSKIPAGSCISVEETPVNKFRDEDANERAPFRHVDCRAFKKSYLAGL